MWHGVSWISMYSLQQKNNKHIQQQWICINLFGKCGRFSEIWHSIQYWLIPFLHPWRRPHPHLLASHQSPPLALANGWAWVAGHHLRLIFRVWHEFMPPEMKGIANKLPQLKWHLFLGSYERVRKRQTESHGGPMVQDHSVEKQSPAMTSTSL